MVRSLFFPILKGTFFNISYLHQREPENHIESFQKQVNEHIFENA